MSKNIFPDPNRNHPFSALRSRSASSMMAAMNSSSVSMGSLMSRCGGVTPVAALEDKGGTREKREYVEKSNWVYKALSLCSDDAKAVFTAVAVSLLYRSSLAKPRLIPIRSTCPTLDEGDRIFAKKVSYVFGEPEVSDIVVFTAPPSLQRKISCSRDVAFVKRIVTKAGDCPGWTNGSVQDDDFILEPLNYEMPPQIIPEGYVYAMGDNRNNSCDSHDWGPLPVEYIVGISILRKPFMSLILETTAW
ncbi:Thylakoidal processing peptidase 1, chloroplastic-like protein [Drosera capensis]